MLQPAGAQEVGIMDDFIAEIMGPGAEESKKDEENLFEDHEVSGKVIEAIEKNEELKNEETEVMEHPSKRVNE